MNRQTTRPTHQILRAGPGARCYGCDVPANHAIVHESGTIFVCCGLAELRDRMSRGWQLCPNMEGDAVSSHQ